MVFGYFQGEAMERDWNGKALAKDPGGMPASLLSVAGAAARGVRALEWSGNPDIVAMDFKQAMRRLAASVSIIATQDDGARFGMVATAVTSVSAEPPAILVCINRNGSIFAPLMRRQQFTVNVLMERHQPLIPAFAGQRPGEDRFAHGEWGEAHALPFLRDSQTTLFCRVDAQLAYGSHQIIIGRVGSIMLAEPIAPLLWQDGRVMTASPLAG